MSGWIRHRGSKSMPKCLEGKKFEVRLRDGSVLEINLGGSDSWWSHNGENKDIMAYRILGNITPPDYSKGFPVGTTAKDIGAKVGDEFVVVVDNGYGYFKLGERIKLIKDDGSACPLFSNGIESNFKDFANLSFYRTKTAIEMQAEEVGIPEPVQEWPEDRANVIGQNGNDGLAYGIDTSPERVENDEEIVHMPTAAPDFLQSALNTLTQRGKDYDKPEGERSAAAVAVAFNAITGKDLTAAEVYLVLQLVKDVRQWQNPERYHADSALDCVAYAALKAEALAKGGK